MSIERNLTRDKEAYREQWLDTPMNPPRAKTREKAFMTPGCHVKSKEISNDSRWPKYFGKLTKISDDEAVVIGKDDHFVWTGKPTAYHSLWECD